MAKKLRIGILGIGAVGGYFGGLLAKRYANSEEAEVIFIARPASEAAINEKGLHLITPNNESIIHPTLLVSKVDGMEPLDLLICSIKSYDLENSMETIKSCISPSTLVLPLLNGVDAPARIKAVMPHAKVLDGCVYLVARLVEPGVIREVGNIHKIYFGSDTVAQEELVMWERLIKEAGIECYIATDSQAASWEKFIFIAGLANLTSYYDLPIGPVMEQYPHEMDQALAEVKQIVDALGIGLPANIIELTLAKIKALPYDGTSSMHSDWRKGGRTEYKSLTEYIVRLGDEHGIDTPLFDKVLAAFEERIRNAATAANLA